MIKRSLDFATLDYDPTLDFATIILFNPELQCLMISLSLVTMSNDQSYNV